MKIAYKFEVKRGKENHTRAASLAIHCCESIFEKGARRDNNNC